MEQLQEIKLDWKNIKSMQIKKKKKKKKRVWNSTGIKFNIQGNTKEKCLNFVTLCATTWSVGEDVRGSSPMSYAPHVEGPTWQSQVWDRQGIHSQLARASLIWLCSRIAAIPLDREKWVGLVNGIQSVCSKTCPNHQKTGRDLFWCQMNAQGSHQEAVDCFLISWCPKHQKTLGQFAIRQRTKVIFIGQSDFAGDKAWRITTQCKLPSLVLPWACAVGPPATATFLFTKRAVAPRKRLLRNSNHMCSRNGWESHLNKSTSLRFVL